MYWSHPFAVASLCESYLLDFKEGRRFKTRPKVSRSRALRLQGQMLPRRQCRKEGPETSARSRNCGEDAIPSQPNVFSFI